MSRLTTRYLIPLLLGLALLLFLPSAPAATVTVSKTPPGVTSKVAPNIVVTFDDSGSMNATAIPDGMDALTGKKYYYSSTGNPIYFDPTVTYAVPPDATGAPLGTPSYKGAWRDGYCANILGKTCWAPSTSRYIAPNVVDLSTSFSTGFLANTLAGNAPCARDANEFNTWYVNGSSCLSMDIPASVRLNGTTTISSTSCNGLNCGVYLGKTGTFPIVNGDGTTTTYTCTTALLVFTTCTIVTTGPAVESGGFYYVCTAAADESTCTFHSVNAESATIQQNFAIWYSYYRTRSLNARAAVGRVFSSMADGSVRVAWQTLQSQSSSGSYNTSALTYTGPAYGPLATSSQVLDLANATTGCTATSTTTACWRSQFMNWLYGAPASGGTPTRVATENAGEFYKRTLKTSPNGQDPYWNGSTSSPGELTCRKNFNMLVTDGYWNGDNPAAVAPTDSTTLTLPDGTTYSVTDTRSSVFWNQSGSLSPSLADIAFAYWANDLRPDLGNNVPAFFTDISTGITGSAATVSSTNPGGTPEVYFNPANDPATWQHMSQYMVTMGISGSLNYPDDYLALRKGTKAWPTPNTGGGATNIDDTWHAALNSRGGYFSAADPTSLVNSLSSILSSVIASSSSALTLSLSTNVLTASTVAFYAGYNTTDWSGILYAESVAADGTVSKTQLWSAGGDLLSRNLVSNPRLITTGTGPGQGTGVPFTYANLSTAEKAIMDSSDGTASAATTDNLGAQRVDWLNGVRTQEGKTLRTRTALLGAIFGSQPAYVASPTGNYSDTFPANSPEASGIADSTTALDYSYSAFLTKWASRQATLYVGANDGMLHAFDARLASVSGATPGRELWGYIPNAVYPNLPAQSKITNFSFVPTVDGSPVVGDVFFNAANAATTRGWHTLLVGSLRLGGRGVFGVDITDPSSMTTATAVASKVLWEFNSNSVSTAGTPANLGYTFGTPVIVRVAYANGSTNGRWVVLVPGGYFPDGSTAAAASNTYSSLFVLDAQTGTLLKEIRTPTGTASHGLTTPAVGDYDGDQVADVAFAGDLDGNVWRIDLSAATLASTTASQGVSLLFKPAAANAQSITTSPRLLADPTSSYFIVVFGTGRYLSTADSADTTTQSLYGIREPGTAVSTPVTVAAGNLVQQSMVVDTASGGIGVTSNAVPASRSGWYLPLNVTPGERVVVTPALDSTNNTVTFSTLLPSAGDPCTTDSSGSVLALDGTSGNAAVGVTIGTSVSFGSGYTLAGARVTGAASSGSLYTAASLSGGTAYAAGQITTAGATFGTSIPTARRRSWRVLNSEN